MEKFMVGDYILSKRFGWQYRIYAIKNGSIYIQDVVKQNLRLAFSRSALALRIKNEVYLHSPHPF